MIPNHMKALFVNVTHMVEMPQWLPALVPAESNRDSPMREMVGAMVSGPMKRMKRPMRPEKPTNTWNSEPTIMEPCSWRQTEKMTLKQLRCDSFHKPLRPKVVFF